MRKIKATKTIAVDKEVHAMLKKEKKEFQKQIGGGTWSYSDTINELWKIAQQTKEVKQ